jgi:hypothetical protein
VPNNHSVETLTAEDLRDLTGTSFLLTAGSPESTSPITLELELIEVTGSSANAPPDAPRAPFSLLFHGPLQPVMPQAIYRLKNAKLGEFELFIVPVGPAVPNASGQPSAAMRYEVIFG